MKLKLRTIAMLAMVFTATAALAGPPIIWNGTASKLLNSGSLYVNSGSVSAPSVTTSGDNDTGLYFPSANQLALGAGGVQNMYFKNDGTRYFHGTSGSDWFLYTGGNEAYFAQTLGWLSWYAVGSGGFFGLGQDNGNQALKWSLQISNTSNMTDPTAMTPGTTASNQAAVALTNKDTTAGNFHSILWQDGAHLTEATSVVAQINGYFDSHTSAAQSGSLDFRVRDSGGPLAQALVLKKNRRVQIPSLAINGMVQSDYLGNITTTAMTAGQILVGVTNNVPVATTLTAGTGISISSGSGGITISASGLAAANRLTKTADYTLSVTDNSIWADATGGAITLTLPASSTAASGGRFRITKIDSSTNAVRVISAGASDVFYIIGTSSSDSSVSLTDPGVSVDFEANGGTAYVAQ